MVLPWRNRLKAISLKVHMWRSEGEVMNVLQFGEYLRDKIPNNKATFLPSEGHSFILKRWVEFLKSLIEGE